jgi:hypothetical protein
MTVAARTIQLLLTSKRDSRDLQIISITRHIVSITQPVHLTLSVVINIFATSIITLKAWCVRVYGVFRKYFAECAFIDDDATCTYIQEIPQVDDGRRDRYPNP